ncbi:hypothetical protein ACH5RR_015039 [Cinchona calisaya]|uniref:Beta-glucosidase n=1 Tax=Cinchona calisaya TaxID=153742 RepID=A0ABD2ZV41_9GENT
MDCTTNVPAGFVRRKDFGSDFIFGSATSAFQIEGALGEDGRGQSIWDTFAAKKNLFSPYGEDAVNHYKKYEEDVKIMKDIGFDAYRFSISWCRILPTGKKESRNQKGIDFYKRLLMNLKTHGMEPFVTLLHFDPPQALEEEYDGFLNRKIVDDFCDYANICFKEFGDQVKYWITVNEPATFATLGYVYGTHAPGLSSLNANYSDSSSSKKQLYSSSTNYATSVAPYLPSDDDNDDHDQDEEAASDDDDEASIFPPNRFSVHPPKKNDMMNMSSGVKGNSVASPVSQEVLPATVPSKKISVKDPSEYPYLVAHHQILAHAKVVKLYRDNYQSRQKGKIGIVLNAHQLIPLNKRKRNQKAAQRATDFSLGWFLDPIVNGDYPENMHKYVTKGYLPEFGADKYMVRGSFDFIGLNYYTARYVSRQASDGGNYITDQRAKFHVKRKGVYIGEEQGAAGWIYGYPRGIMDLLVYIKEKYNNPLIYVAENGIDDPDDDSSTHWKSFYDQRRIVYLHDHLSFVGQAKQQGVNVKGYFVWSLLDNFEWDSGFKSRFGITYVDYDNGSKRCPKLSASWLKSLLAK